MIDHDLKNKFETALKLGRKRKYSEAAALLTEIIDSGSKFHEAYMYLGRSYHGMNLMQEAIQTLRHYLILVPDSAAGNFFLGRALLAAGFPKSAVPHLKKAVNAHPNSVHATGFLGIAYLKAGRSDIAIGYLSKAVESSKKISGIYKIYLGTLFIRAVSNFKSGNFDLAAQMFRFLIENSFDNILTYIYMGMIERHNGNYKSALEYYDLAIQYSPEDKLLLFRRAVLLDKIGKKDLAVEELKKLNIEPDIDENSYLAFQYFVRKNFNKAVYYANLTLHNKPGSIDIHLLLGEANRELKYYEIAENHYRKAIKLDRTKLEGRYGLSLLFWIKEDYVSMMNELKKISVSDPGNSISSYYIALCKCKLKINPDETIIAVREEIRKNKPDAYLFNALGEQYIRGGLDELSEKWFQKAISVNSNLKDPYKNLLEYYKRYGSEKKLLKTYQNYPDLDSEITISTEYIRMLYKLKKYKTAISQIKKLFTLQPGTSDMIRMLANCYKLTSNWENASMLYRQLLSKDHENEIFLQALAYCLHRLGKTESALELVDNAIAYLKKPSLDLILIEGVLAYKLKEYDKALKAFRSTLHDNPSDWRIYNNIAMIYKEKGMVEYSDQFFARADEYKNK